MIYVPSKGTELLDRVSIGMWIWPTLPQRGVHQVLLNWWDSSTNEGFTLALDAAGRPYFDVSTPVDHERLVSLSAVRARTWYHVSAGVDLTEGRMAVALRALDGHQIDVASSDRPALGEAEILRMDGPITVASAAVPNGVQQHSADSSYDGKIEEPVVGRAWPQSWPGGKGEAEFQLPVDQRVGRWNLS